MHRAKPSLKCVDYWPTQIPPEKLAAYKRLHEAGQIGHWRVVYNRPEGSTTVEYRSTVPHEWILEDLARASLEVRDSVD